MSSLHLRKRSTFHPLPPCDVDVAMLESIAPLFPLAPVTPHIWMIGVGNDAAYWSNDLNAFRERFDRGNVRGISFTQVDEDNSVTRRIDLDIDRSESGA
jgi:hypothetical protein